MPIYEYRCPVCGERLSLFYRTFAQAPRAETASTCPDCGSASLERVVSRPTLLRSEATQLDILADPGALAALDGEDPQAMAHLLRTVGAALGEEPVGEMGEIIDRLEAGESPAQVGAALPSTPDAVAAARSQPPSPTPA